MKQEPIYNKAIHKWSLKKSPYGLIWRHNKEGQSELLRDTNADISIFDKPSFIFYLIKYCEILGLDALLAAKQDITYNQKRKIIEYIVKEESELGVTDTSWKHCLLFLFLNGCITEI